MNDAILWLNITQDGLHISLMVLPLFILSITNSCYEFYTNINICICEGLVCMCIQTEYIYVHTHTRNYR